MLFCETWNAGMTTLFADLRWGGCAMMSTHRWLDCKTQIFAQQPHHGDDSHGVWQYDVAYFPVSDFYDLFLFWTGGDGMDGFRFVFFNFLFFEAGQHAM